MNIRQLQTLYNASDSKIKCAKHNLERIHEIDINKSDA